MKFPIKSLILLGSAAPFAAYCQMNQWLLLSDFEDGEAGLVETFHVDLDPSYEVAAIFAVLEDPVDAENSVFWWDASGYGINWNAHRMNMPLPQEVPEGEVATLYFRSYSEGYSHDGCTCSRPPHTFVKRSYTRGSTSPDCPDGEEYDAARP